MRWVWGNGGGEHSEDMGGGPGAMAGAAHATSASVTLDPLMKTKTLTRISRMNTNWAGFAVGRGGMINIKN